LKIKLVWTKLDLAKGGNMYHIHGTVNIHEAKTHFSELVNAATEGREIFIAKAGKPVAKLVSIKTKKTKVRFGVLKGKIKVADDFDAPLPDEIIDLFEG
jgi:prevent-host-death family protein